MKAITNYSLNKLLGLVISELGPLIKLYTTESLASILILTGTSVLTATFQRNVYLMNARLLMTVSTARYGSVVSANTGTLAHVLVVIGSGLLRVKSRMLTVSANAFLTEVMCQMTPRAALGLCSSLTLLNPILQSVAISLQRLALVAVRSL
jgi:hypothetical protein